MKLTLYIVLALALALTACRSKKSVAAATAVHTTEQSTTDSTAVARSAEVRADLFAAVADSVRVQIVADSIVTPGGVIYAPGILIEAHRPAVVSHRSENVSRADSVDYHVSAGAYSIATSQYAADTATDAGGTSLSGLLIRAGLTILLIGAIILYGKYYLRALHSE